jgi:hypothetical protein
MDSLDHGIITNMFEKAKSIRVSTAQDAIAASDEFDKGKNG